jgi:capsular polysaccharide export protein
LRRNVIFVDSARPIVKSYRRLGENVYTDGMIGVGMRQFDLVSATGPAPRAGGLRLSAEPAGSGLLAAGIAASETGALAALFPDFTIARSLRDLAAAEVSGVVSWSDLRDKGRARSRAAALRVPFLQFGPGLLRAPPGWGPKTPILSVTAQAMTGHPSPVDILSPDRLLASTGWESPELLGRAARLRREIVYRRLAGAWWNSEADRELPRGGHAVVLGDGNWGRADGSPPVELLSAMLAAARAENGSRQIVFITPGHAGSRSLPAGFIRDSVAGGCTVLSGTVDIWEAVARAESVYTAGGETGFLALLAGARIRCFADSFYSGWGITTDEPGVWQKPIRRTVEEVFAGACLLATRYLDPYRREPASCEDILEILGEWQKIEAVNRRIVVCLGMSFWKRRQVRDFLRSSSGTPAFRRTKNAALAAARREPPGSIAVWASRAPPGLAEAAGQQGIPLIRVEDGFVRSVGLGSDFIPAASLVLDSRGMHFDPSARSDLERILAETEFDAALIERARDLIARLVARGITKYNVGNSALPIEWPAGKRRILVPGQVEDDLSVRLGGDGITRNLDLLTRVRAANPDAFIVYKPHPDVEAGHREGKVADEVAANFADTVIRNISTAAVLAEIDELHTLTSLAGFEALLRGRRVVVYGRPFYAGWGLTSDLAGTDRGRRLTLEELVAGALILYPRYLDPVTRLPCTPELVIERLASPELWRPGLLVAARRLQGLWVRRWRETLVKSARLFAKSAASSGS